MDLKQFFTLISRKKQTIFSLVLIFLLLAVILTVVQPFRYGSSSQLLVIQNFGPNIDPYTASKSNEYLSNILARVISSNSFYNNVMGSGFNIDKNYFSGTIKDQMKTWQETVSAKAVNDSGIISLSVFHKDKIQAEQIARAVGYTLQTKHTLYHGGGNNVSIKIIDEPITSNFPVKPDIILNIGLGLALGIIFSLFYIYLFPEEKYSLKLFPKKQRLESFYSMPEDFRADKQSYRGIEDNWKSVAQVLEKKMGQEQQDFLDEPIKAQPSPAEKIKELDQAVLPDEFDNQPAGQKIAYEDIIKQGSMKNIFGNHEEDL